MEFRQQESGWPSTRSGSVMIIHFIVEDLRQGKLTLESIFTACDHLKRCPAVFFPSRASYRQWIFVAMIRCKTERL